MALSQASGVLYGYLKYNIRNNLNKIEKKILVVLVFRDFFFSGSD